MNGKTFYFLLVMILGSHYRHASSQGANQFRPRDRRYADANSPLSSPFETSDLSEEDRPRWLQTFNRANILNTVLKQLQLNPHVGNFRINDDLLKQDDIYRKFTPDSSSMEYPEYTGPITEYNTEREARQLGAENHISICPFERNEVSLNNNEYEYRPAHYDEIRCINSEFRHYSKNEICSSLGFSCVQWNKTIHLTRRRFSSGCWETDTRIIPAACECMWPVHKLGDINLHT